MERPHGRGNHVDICLEMCSFDEIYVHCKNGGVMYHECMTIINTMNAQLNDHVGWCHGSLRRPLRDRLEGRISTALWHTGHRPETSVSQGSKQVF